MKSLEPLHQLTTKFACAALLINTVASARWNHALSLKELFQHFIANHRNPPHPLARRGRSQRPSSAIHYSFHPSSYRYELPALVWKLNPPPDRHRRPATKPKTPLLQRLSYNPYKYEPTY
jgi:hypothetical protein